MIALRVEAGLERVVVRFGTPTHSISAYTLSTALVGFADAIRAAHRLTSIGSEVDVVVDVLREGSFEAVIRAVVRPIGNLFSAENAKSIGLALVSSYIFANSCLSEEKPTYVINGDVTFVKNHGGVLIVDNAVILAEQQVSRSSQFLEAINRFVSAIEHDESITEVSISTRPDDPIPPLPIPRREIAHLSRPVKEEGEVRKISERTTLLVSKPVLARGRRKWEFVWRGIRVGAPILDDVFLSRFAAREYHLAPGDALDVDLRITQERHPVTRAFLNTAYEVVRVHDLVRGEAQSGF